MRRIAVLVAALTGLVVSTAPRVSGQVLAGLRAEWADLATWTRALENREVEHGLGLHLSGPSGQTLMAFTGVLSARDPNLPPKELGIQVSTGRMTNPNLMRIPRLEIVADAGAPNAKSFELTSRLIVDNSSPGAIISDGVARIASADFARLAAAKSIKGNILGFDFTLRADQVAALKAFAVRVKVAR